MRYQQDMSMFRRKFLFSKAAVEEILRKIKTIVFSNKKKVLSRILDNRKEFKYNLGIATIIKNESPYILEWIEYHRNIGFSRFYIYDNDSTDNVDILLAKYTDMGVVVLTKIHGAGKQLIAYDDAVERSKNEVKWLAVLDADEFIQDLTGESLSKILQRRHQVAVLLGWMIFGSNDQKEKENGLVIERFTRHARDDFIADYKIILNPRKVLKWMNPHYAQMLGMIRDENGKVIHSYPFNTMIQAVPASKKKATH